MAASALKFASLLHLQVSDSSALLIILAQLKSTLADALTVGQLCGLVRLLLSAETLVVCARDALPSSIRFPSSVDSQNPMYAAQTSQQASCEAPYLRWRRLPGLNWTVSRIRIRELGRVGVTPLVHICLDEACADRPTSGDLPPPEITLPASLSSPDHRVRSVQLR